MKLVAIKKFYGTITVAESVRGLKNLWTAWKWTV